MEGSDEMQVERFIVNASRSHTEGPNSTVLAMVPKDVEPGSLKDELILANSGPCPRTLKLDEAFGDKVKLPDRVHATVIVLEMKGNGIVERQILPKNCLDVKKWESKGVLVYVSHNHSFLEWTEIPRNWLCNVCHLSVLRYGDCGLSCRDCKYVCHKSCLNELKMDCREGSMQALNMKFSLL